MNPVLENLAVAAIIAGAIAFFLVRYLRARRGGKGCDSGGCGCASREKNKLPR